MSDRPGPVFGDTVPARLIADSGRYLGSALFTGNETKKKQTKLIIQ